jgi:acetyltransferase-like isoleucine patch superfamily enzyme
MDRLPQTTRNRLPMSQSSTTKNLLAACLLPLAMLSNALEDHWRKLWAFVRLQASLGKLDKSVVVLGMPELQGTKRIRLGRNLYLYRDLYLETQQEGEIDVGNDVVMSRGVHVVAFASIRIGDGTIIGEYTSIRDANHRFGNGLAVRHSGHDIKPISIGRNVWIGRGATILPGVVIGDNAVIGANAVVTRDVAADSVAVGIPARPLRGAGQ